MEKRQLSYLNKEINYELHRKSVKNINIRVKSSGVVYVSAPKKTELSYIEAILLKRADWIFQTLVQFQEKTKNDPMEVRYNQGDVLMFMGNKYNLSIIQSSKERVETTGNEIYVYVKEPMATERKKKLYEDWLRTQSLEIFLVIMEQQIDILKNHLKNKPQLKVRKMKARWGTCFSTKNTIQLNLELIKKPRAAIEYVILHELAHFIHPNHSKSFYAFVESFMPDWKSRKLLLKH